MIVFDKDHGYLCINLRKSFGDKYRVRLEKQKPAVKFGDPWYHIIPCQYGHIYPHGDSYLGFASDIRGLIAHRVARLPFTTVTQDGDDGMNIIFDVKHFDEVSRIVRPRRRRRLSPDQKAAAISRLAAYRKEPP